MTEILKYKKKNEFNGFIFLSKYPASLSVTVSSYQPESTQSVSLTRPMSVLEEEITGDIYTCDSDGEEFSEQLSKPNDKNFDQNLPEKLNRNEIKMLNLESRLPGQVR